METVGACFVNMVMDRLQTLEGDSMQQLATLRQENMHLKQQVQQLARSLYLRAELHTFSDGWVLYPGFGCTEDRMQNEIIAGDPDEEPLDEAHLNASAFYGRIGLDLCCYQEGSPLDEPADLLVLGQDGQYTTVRQLLLELNQYCTVQREAGRKILPDTVSCYEGFGHSGYDAPRNVTVHSMYTDDDE